MFRLFSGEPEHDGPVPGFRVIELYLFRNENQGGFSVETERPLFHIRRSRYPQPSSGGGIPISFLLPESLKRQSVFRVLYITELSTLYCPIKNVLLSYLSYAIHVRLSINRNRPSIQRQLRVSRFILVKSPSPPRKRVADRL